jgi:hypothetical protein
MDALVFSQRGIQMDHDTAHIPLTMGMCAIVDLPDLGEASKYSWCAHRGRRTWYAARGIYLPDGKRGIQHLHSFLTGFQIVDHANGDGLDNRRSNLRESTYELNGANKLKRRDSQSQFKGLTKNRNGKWVAQIGSSKTNIYLGQFDLEEDAARAYDEAARIRFGEWATLNFPLPGERSALTGEIRREEKADE